MKQRYDESFLFPQGQLDYGRALMFPQGQLHGLGAAPTQDEINAYSALTMLDPNDPYQRGVLMVEIAKRKAQKVADDAYDAWTAARIKAAPLATALMVTDSTGRYTDASIQAANAAVAQAIAPQTAALDAAEANIDAATREAQKQVIADQLAAQVKASVSTVAKSAAAAATVVAVTPAVTVKIPQTIVTPPPKAPDQVTNYVVDFDGVEFTMKDPTGKKIGGGSPNYKTLDIFIAPFHVAAANVTVTPAAAAKFAANSAAPATTGTVATSTGVTATTGTPVTVTTNQTTGTTTVTNTATGVTATTTPATGTTTVGTTSGINTGNLALIGLLGFLLLRGAVR